MKILFSITYYLPYVSGLTLAASRWAEGLKKKGNHVRVLCMSGRGPGVIAAKPLVRVSKGFLSWDWVVKSWQQVQKHDVIVVSLPQFEGVIPALFGRIFGKRVIAIYHCEIVTTPFIQWMMEISHVMTLLLSDEIVTYTKDYADSSKLLRLLTLPRSLKMKYIVPPIPKPRENKQLTGRLRKRIGKTDFVIGVAARLAREKGIEYLLESLPLLSSRAKRGDPDGLPAGKAGIASSRRSGIRNDNIKIAIAGPMEPVGEESYKEKIMKVVRKYKKQVIFLGSIPPEYMGSFYKLIDVLVLPSVNSTEAFGMVQVEAMLAGVRVVASDLPGVRVPVKKTGMGIVVSPKDSKKLAEAITKILKHQDQHKKDIPKTWTPDQSIKALDAVCRP